MRKNGTWPKTKIIQTTSLLFIQAQGKVRKNEAWPKTKIIQRTSFYLLDYNCNLQSNWIIKNKSLDYHLIID